MRNIIIAAVSLGCVVSAHAELGIASWYDHPRFKGLIAAHKTLPFGTRVKITNLSNHRTTVVTIVDRGPYGKGRILDVSPLAANTLGFLRLGLANVTSEIIR